MKPRVYLSLLLSFGLFCILAPGLGYRHLWADEAETAERARTITESGLPKTIDDEGRISASSGGIEVEEGSLHRYTPWAQFYFAAAGLKLSQVFGFSKDAGVRLPSVLAHSAGSGMIAYGLMAFAEASAPIAVSVGLAFGIQTMRISHDRTARYHALLDFLVILGILGIGASRKKKKWGNALLMLSIFLLPQVQSIGGSLLSFALCVIYFLVYLFRQKFGTIRLSNFDFIRKIFFVLVLPGLSSIIVLLILSRPWLQTAWGTFSFIPSLHSLADVEGVSYGLYFIIFSLGVLLWPRLKRKSLALQLAFIIISTLLVMSLLESHPFSQARYYMSLPVLVCLWPIYLDTEKLDALTRKWIFGGLLTSLILVEVMSYRFPIYQGLRVSWDDWRKSAAHERQPLQEAMEIIKEQSSPTDPILFNYSPQIASWYLPEHPLALLPDLSNKTDLNKNNPMWNRELWLPKWHVWYPSYSPGYYNCDKKCDFQIKEFTAEHYRIVSNRLRRDQEMCVVRTWKTNQWNNAPFELEKAQAINPAGTEAGLLVLAKACP